jgi:hypothetical protein
MATSRKQHQVAPPPPSPPPDLYNAARQFGEVLDAEDKVRRRLQAAREALETAALAYHNE